MNLIDNSLVEASNGKIIVKRKLLGKQFIFIPEDSPLKKSVEYFDLTEEYGLKKCIEDKDFTQIDNYRKSSAPTLQVVMYKTKSGKVAAAQLQKYVPYEYVAASNISVAD